MTLGKHFINGVEDPAFRALRANLYSNPNLSLLTNEKVLLRRPTQGEDRVQILCGGGSGHEPAYSGYLGDGMLDIAVAGQVFASPSATQVEAGIRAAQTSKGVLLIVKNYTGDKLNFGLAAEKAKSAGFKVETVFVGEDVSIEGSSLVGQRGLAGIIFVLKISGALAAAGGSLEQVASIARHASSRLATAAASLDKCSVPSRGPQESIPYDTVEYGMGIHNEPGVSRDSFSSMQGTVKRVVDMLLLPAHWATNLENDLALMVNNLGGLGVLELNVIADESIRQMKGRGLRVVRFIVGTFLTSLDGPGFSLTLLELDQTLTPLFDAACAAPAWPRITPTASHEISGQMVNSSTRADEQDHQIEFHLTVSTSLLNEIVEGIACTTSQDEPIITEYDTLAGDGDCGETLLSGVKRLTEETRAIIGDRVAVYEFVRCAARAAESGMGGTSGALYAIFLNALASRLRKRSEGASWAIFKGSLDEALSELCKYTLARQGHRTLMDALIPFIKVLQTSDLDTAYQAARKGAESTRKMTASLGRASYVGKDVFEQRGGIPDPGALGVVSIIRGIAETLDHASLESQSN